MPLAVQLPLTSENLLILLVESIVYKTSYVELFELD